MLLDQKAKLVGYKQDVDEENPIHDVDRLDDNASADTDASEEVSILNSEVLSSEASESLARVNDALKRMEKGTYGHTDDGTQIPVERLLADPTATTLVAK